MSFIKSLIFNCTGEYNVFGNKVLFTNPPSNNNLQAISQMHLSKEHIANMARHLLIMKKTPHNSVNKINIKSNQSDNNSQTISQTTILKNRIVNMARHFIVMNRLTHTFIHEMSHAITAQLFTGLGSKIEIYVDIKKTKELGITHHPRLNSDWKNSLVAFTGPMVGVAFETCKIAALTRLKKNLLPLPISVLLATQATLNIVNECWYGLTSAYHKDGGDFGQIAKKSKIHLALTGSLFAAQCALGMYNFYKFLRH